MKKIGRLPTKAVSCGPPARSGVLWFLSRKWRFLASQLKVTLLDGPGLDCTAYRTLHLIEKRSQSLKLQQAIRLETEIKNGIFSFHLANFFPCAHFKIHRVSSFYSCLNNDSLSYALSFLLLILLVIWWCGPLAPSITVVILPHSTGSSSSRHLCVRALFLSLSFSYFALCAFYFFCVRFIRCRPGCIHITGHISWLQHK